MLADDEPLARERVRGFLADNPEVEVWWSAGTGPRRFVRVHRSAVVNLDRVRRLEPWFHGEFEVVMEDGTRPRSSRTFSGRVRELIR